MLGKALNAVEVVTFDYPCKFDFFLLGSLFQRQSLGGLNNSKI